jgi:hypothetical protein
MSYEIKVALINIDGEWYEFRGMESIAWMIRWDEKSNLPYIHQDTGEVIVGTPLEQVMFA